jgi:HPt (histidine-containing phosphotransfer) domain-containing protein
MVECRMNASPSFAATEATDDFLAPARERFRALLVERILSFEGFRQQATNGADVAQALTGISDLAHKLSGVGATLGFAELGAIAATLEQSIAADRQAETPPAQCFAAIDPLLESLLDEMEDHIEV